MLDENQKIGVGLICLGLGFIVLGVMLFFDASLIAIGIIISIIINVPIIKILSTLILLLLLIILLILLQ